LLKISKCNQMLRRCVSAKSAGTLQRCAKFCATATNWNFRFSVQNNALRAEYDLPTEIVSPQQAVSGFLGPLREELRRGPKAALDNSSAESLQDTIRLLTFLDELEKNTTNMLAEHRVMEALVLLTTQWKFASEVGADGILHICPERSLEDRGPAMCMLAGIMLGPLAWVPGILVINEIVMRRCKRYGAFAAPPPSMLNEARAGFTHHLVRMLYEKPRLVVLKECYHVGADIDMTVLQQAVLNGSHAQHVSGYYEKQAEPQDAQESKE